MTEGLEGVFSNEFSEAQNEISSPAIQEIMPAIHTLVASLRDHFLTGDYGLLVGEGDSSFIPTTILRGVINHINSNRGESDIPTVFIKGTKYKVPDQGKRLLLEQLETLPEGEKALLVAEFMLWGDHMKQVGNVIHEGGASFDIATVWHQGKLMQYRHKKVLRDDENIFGGLYHTSSFPGLYAIGKLTESGSNYIGTYNPRRVYETGQPTSVTIPKQDLQSAVNQLVSVHKL